MEDSGAILCQISNLKQMLDQVNEEIETTIQNTREIESEIYKCSEVEKGFALREAELMKINCVSQFEIHGLIQVSGTARTSLEMLEKELRCLRTERDNLCKRMADKREAFLMECKNFQRDITVRENDELHGLLSEKEAFEIEIYKLNTQIAALRNSVSAFVEEILEELRNSTSALEIDIGRGNLENKKLAEDIEELKKSLITIGASRNRS